MSDDPMSWALLRIEELENRCEHLETDRNNCELLINDLTCENKKLRNELTERIHMCDMRSEKILELIAERDEARREICIMLEDATNNHRKNHAKRWGWDCFKGE
jgi:SMC interacting uncharacterized protein involved in chromosome segregation